MLTEADLKALASWNTPTVYNAWEAITAVERTRGCFNRVPTTDFVPEARAIAGYAVTVEVEPSNPKWPLENSRGWDQYREYIASVPGPKIVVVKDLDEVAVGAFFGEVNSTIHRALGCVGAITDGALRDLEEVRRLGFKHLARQLCVGHAYSHPVRWDVPLTVFGCDVRPGDLIHADVHGFIVLPEPDRAGLLDAARFIDAAERSTLIEAAASHQGGIEELPTVLSDAQERFEAMMRERFATSGEF
jgi:4-hydroxy-4-methyl-2-oxoglutarate aldolase